MKNYSENRKLHLGDYAKKMPKPMPIGGTFNYKGDIKKYNHILNVENKSKTERIGIIEKYNLIDVNFKFKGFIEEKQIHRFAHHLNSSQVLCYNYFRPMIDDNHHPEQKLINLMKEKVNIDISKDANCEFEYVENDEEGTNFDFYIEEGDVKVFFEIKYTEEGFGKAKNDDTHLDKFNNVYTKMQKKCQCLKKDNKVEKDNKVKFDEFRKSYQLYRNVLRVTDKNKYVVFVFPKENEGVKKQYDAFSKKINDEYRGNVICLYWEDIVGKDSELYKKYFAK